MTAWQQKLKALEAAYLEAAEQQALERQLIQTDRLSTVGTLATGVAHQINNPLAYIIANLDFVLPLLSSAKGDPDSIQKEEIEQVLREARDGAERIRTIVKDLQTLTGAAKSRRQTSVDLRRSVEATVRILEKQINQRARVKCDLNPVPTIDANEALIGQTLLNLVLNAVQAIPPGSPQEHQIRVTTTTTRLGEAQVTIEDTGVGIQKEKMRHIFDPFFTTREVGKGTGLGLSVAYGVVTDLGGSIRVEPASPQGSIFSVVIPAGEPSDQPQRAPEATVSRRGRVLVVDDEPAIRRMLERDLRHKHEVMTREGGEAALAMLEDDADLDVILCDVIMPGVSGPDIQAEIEKRWPRLSSRIIFMTGGAFTESAEAFLAATQNLCVTKPFRMSELHDMIDQVMARSD